MNSILKRKLLIEIFRNSIAVVKPLWKESSKTVITILAANWVYDIVQTGLAAIITEYNF